MLIHLRITIIPWGAPVLIKYVDHNSGTSFSALCLGPRPPLCPGSGQARLGSPQLGSRNSGDSGSSQSVRKGNRVQQFAAASCQGTQRRPAEVYEGLEEMADAFAGIEFGLIPKERYNDVIVHLRDNFFADEPLNFSVELCQPGEPHAELEEHSLNTLRDGLSQMAVHTDTGQVVGVALNGIQRPGDAAAAKAKLEYMKDDKFAKIFNLLYGMNQDLDLFKVHNVDRIFECRILSVDQRFRGRGLAKELLRRSEETAREEGFKVLKEDATGFFSQRVAESLGLHTVRQVRYSEYTTDTGEVVFHTQQPHDCLKIMVKLLH